MIQSAKVEGLGSWRDEYDEYSVRCAIIEALGKQGEGVRTIVLPGKYYIYVYCRVILRDLRSMYVKEES